MGSAAGCPTLSAIVTRIQTCRLIPRSPRRSHPAAPTDEASTNDDQIDWFNRRVGIRRRGMWNEGSSGPARSNRTDGTRAVRKSGHGSHTYSRERDSGGRSLRRKSGIWRLDTSDVAVAIDGQLFGDPYRRAPTPARKK